MRAQGAGRRWCSRDDNHLRPAPCAPRPIIAVMEAVIAAGLLLPDLTRSVAEEHLDELEKLIETAGGNVVGKVLARRFPSPRPSPVGRGRILFRFRCKPNASVVVTALC